MILERATGALLHRRIGDLPHVLAPGSVLVLNDTRVLHARLTGVVTGDRQVPFLLLEGRLRRHALAGAGTGSAGA